MTREGFRRALDRAIDNGHELTRRAKQYLANDTSEAARKAWITRRAGRAALPPPGQPRVKAAEPPKAAPVALPPQPAPAGVMPKPDNWAQMSPGKKAAWTKAARLMAGIGMALPKPLAKAPAAPGAKRTAFEGIARSSKLTLNVPVENAQQIASIADKLNLTGLMEKWPLNKFVFDNWKTAQKGVRGWYRAKFEPAGIGSELHVAGELTMEPWKGIGARYFPDEWSETYRPNASSTGKDILESRQITFTHELAHHFNTRFDQRLKQAQDAAYAHALRTNSCVSDYAKTNKLEYFAETWAYYHFHPDILKRADPVGYNLVAQAKDYLANAPVGTRKAA